MKRFTKLLSLFLLSLVGMTNATAQDYVEGDLIETAEDVVGKKIVLFSAGGISNDHPAGFMCGNEVFSDMVQNECVMEFVPVNEQVDGYELYVLKQVVTGKYFMDPKFIDDESEIAQFTEDINKAFKMTVLPYEDVTGIEDAKTTRTSAVEGYVNGAGERVAKQSVSTLGFVLTRDAVYDETDEEAAGQVMYLGGFSRPVYSPYMDTNIWIAYTVQDVTGAEKLSNYLGKYFNNPVTEEYPAGVNPGCYKAEVVEAAAAVVTKAEKIILGQSTATDKEIDQLCADLVAAHKSLQEALIPISEGYYFINNDANRFFSTNIVKGVEFLWALSEYSIPETLSVDDVKQIWYVTPGDTLNHFYVKNLYSGNFINGESDPAVKSDGDNCYTLGDKGQIGIALEGKNSKASFLFYEINEKNYNDHSQQFHAKFNNSGVMTWAEATSANNCFHFTAVSKEDIDKVLAQAEQVRKNELLQAAYDKSLSAYNSGFAFAGAPKDTVFAGNGGLVAEASQLFSDSQDPSEGSMEGLLDGDFTTFFHSDWHNPNVVEFHSIGVDLKKAVNRAIQVKMSKRLNTKKLYCIDYPVILDIYASNDTTGGAWNKVAADVEMNWSTAREHDGKTYEGAVGYAAASYEGAYQFFKFVVKKTDRDSKFFAISGLNVYQGVEDPENSTISQVSAETRQLMESELAKAKKELDAAQATDETLASLNAAYDKFVKELPVPALLESAIQEAKTLANKMENDQYIGEGAGYYTAESLATLRAAITTAEAFDAKGQSAAAINAQVDAVKAAVAAFKASLQLPAAGTYVRFRGMSDKAYTNQLTSYKALVYSNNNTLDGGVFFTRPDGAQDGVIGETEFTDTIDLDNMKYLWYVEKAENSKLVLRNVGSGMYFAPQKGEIHQSVEPFEITMYSGNPGIFVLDAGNDTQVNAASTGVVVTWPDMTDHNAWWEFETVEKTSIDSYNSYWSVTPDAYQIMTLPFAIEGSNDGTIYSLVGQTEDNKFVLAENMDIIPAATPFIFKANAEIRNNKAVFFHSFEGGVSIGEGGSIVYNFVPGKVEGIQGTVCNVDTVGAGYGYLNAGKVTATSKTTIGVNSGYFDATHKTGVDETEGDAVLELGKVEITSIDNAGVVVLPSVVNVYSIDGVLVRKNVKAAQAVKGLPAGLYIVGSQKVLVK